MEKCVEAFPMVKDTTSHIFTDRSKGAEEALQNVEGANIRSCVKHIAENVKARLAIENNNYCCSFNRKKNNILHSTCPANFNF